MDPRPSARVREPVSGVLHTYTPDCELAALIRKKIFFPTRFAHSVWDPRPLKRIGRRVKVQTQFVHNSMALYLRSNTRAGRYTYRAVGTKPKTISVSPDL